ncbi:MAG: DUF4493 domain-containing protein [Bacteroidales bacterium]|nr:DUF4493 domain-containing protein [Bacteroidales bacterium]
MKKIIATLLAATSLLAVASCESLMQTFSRQGTLQIRFADGTVPSTRAAFPDTNDFILTITDSNGQSIFDGLYGAVEENMQLDEGTYTVSARNCDFSAPLFDTPQYGDTQVASIKAGKTTVVTLACVQLNSGIRLRIDPSFLTTYPNAVLYLKASSGRLMYSYTEKRIAYFLPGTVNLDMADGGSETTIFTTRLEPQQILTLGVNTGTESSRSGIKVQVDTTRNWTDESFVIGGGGGSGSGKEQAYSVSEAREHAPEEDTWVYGFIVGGDLSSSKCSFSAPFSSRTNLVLAGKSSTKDKSKCLSVQLAKGGIRDALNLVDHPELLGRQIYLKGDLVESYYGIPGLQNLSEYEFK